MEIMILTDQGTNLMSRLIAEIYNLLHIQLSPYRPQTDGLVERFNRSRFYAGPQREKERIGTR